MQNRSVQFSTYSSVHEDSIIKDCTAPAVEREVMGILDEYAADCYKWGRINGGDHVPFEEWAEAEGYDWEDLIPENLQEVFAEVATGGGQSAFDCGKDDQEEDEDAEE